ncbi:hypothetical protein LINPERHAP1_LOCUS6976 [Linum perenne]
MENVSAESMEDIEPPPPGCQSISPSKPSVQPATLSPPPGWESIPPSQKSEEPATLPPPPSSPPPLPQLPPHPECELLNSFFQWRMQRWLKWYVVHANGYFHIQKGPSMSNAVVVRRSTLCYKLMKLDLLTAAAVLLCLCTLMDRHQFVAHLASLLQKLEYVTQLISFFNAVLITVNVE